MIFSIIVSLTWSLLEAPESWWKYRWELIKATSADSLVVLDHDCDCADDYFDDTDNGHVDSDYDKVRG